MRLSVLGFALCTALLSGAVGAATQEQAVSGIKPMLMPTCGGDDGGGPGPDGLRQSKAIRTNHANSATIASSLLPRVHGRTAALEVIGATPTEVRDNFAGVIEGNFSNGGTEQLVSRLSDKELAAIASYYQRSAGKNGPLLKTFARRLSDVSMLRVAQAFDRASVQSAVDAYASPQVRASFSAKVASVEPMLPPTGGGGNGGGSSGGGSGGNPPGTGAGPSPTTDMTLEEIYLEYRTAPVGSLSPASSLSETVLFSAGKIGPYAAGGAAVGTVINDLIDKYDPDLGDAIGGTIDGSIQAAYSAATDVEQGHYESAFDDLFGFPVTNSQSAGDWDVGQPMLDYYDAGGGCGW